MGKKQTEETMIQQYKNEKKGLFISSLIFFILIVLLAAALYQNTSIPYEDTQIREGSIASYGDGFVNEATGKAVVSSALELKKGETVSLSKQLPVAIDKDLVLSFQNNGLSVKAYVDGREIYQYGLSNAEELGREVGLIWNYIDIRNDMAGQTLTLKLTAYTEKAYLSMQSFGLGNISATNLNILKANSSILVGSLLAAFIGIVFLTYSLFLMRKKISGAKLFLYVGSFSLLSAIWVFTDSTLMQFITGQMAVRYQLSYYSFILLFIPLVLLLKEGCVGHQTWLNVLHMLFGAGFLLCAGLYITGVLPLSKSIIIIHALILLAFVSTVVVTVRECKLYHNKKIIEPFSALAILFAAGAADMAAYYTKAVTDSSMVFRCGLMLFIVFFSLTILRRSFVTLRDSMIAEYYKKLAFVDSVTGGNTLQYFEESVPKWLKTDNEYALVYFDIVRFKMVNDDIGREAGNQVLKAVYEMLELYMQPNEVLCHAGSAHFAMLLETGTKNNIPARLASMKKAINQVPIGELKKNQMSVCAGIYMVGQEQRAVSQMLDRAIMARNGEGIENIDGFGYKLYSDGIRLKMVRENELKNRMLQGMEKGEFKVYLQPKVLLQTGRVNAAEALARWEDPEEGMIFPSEFIPVFENNGAIIKMNLYMLRGVCSILKDWIKRGITPVVISVNLSKISIHNPLFMSEFTAIMEDPETPVKYLEFEFTENAAYENPDKLNELIEQIHAWGATCSIDDFGCSYSNLNMLKDVPVDVLKLDKDFFDYRPENKKRALRIVESIIRLAHSIGMEIVAEGVEDEVQADYLKEIDCDMIQGFYYSRPLSVENFEKYWRGSSL